VVPLRDQLLGNGLGGGGSADILAHGGLLLGKQNAARLLKIWDNFCRLLHSNARNI
jgi:hypothetical protein